MSFYRGLFGHFQWLPPQWLLKAGVRRVGTGLAAIALILATAALGFYYYQSLPKPPRVVVHVLTPGITPLIDGELQPLPLVLNFSLKVDPRAPVLTVESVASLEQSGEVLSDGVSIQPEIEGQWFWSTENQLRFQPSEDWPAGQEYVVRYTANLFAPNLELAATKVSFTTIGFSAAIEELSFHQDPVEKSVRKVVATLSFSHPVGAESLRQHLNYRMRDPGATVKQSAIDIAFDVQLGPHQRVAYIHSEQIEIPPQETYLSLHVSKGLASTQGPARLAEDLLEKVRIPDIASYFRVRDVSSVLARDDADDPIQTLTFEFSDHVRRSRLQEKLSAFLLPAQVRVDGVWHNTRYWRSPREITPEVLLQAEKLEITLAETERDSSILHSAAVDLPENRSVYLTIAAGLVSDSDFVLSQPYDDVVLVPGYPKEAAIAQSGAILPLTGSKQLTFVSRGVDTLRVELGRLLDDNVNHLASQTGGDIQSPYFSSYRFDKDNLTTRVTRMIDLNAEHPGKSVYSSLDLSEYLPDGGYYFVSVQGWDTENDRAVGSADHRFVLISDIGLLVKANADSTQDVFVHSIATGKPLSGATISLLGKNGIPIIERRSSADGRVTMPATKGFEREQSPTVFVVRQGKDSIFMPFARHDRSLQYSRFDIGGNYSQQRSDDQSIKAQVFTDRGIYRPGDTVNIAAIVKRDDWKSFDGIPLVWRVADARGRTALEKTIRLPEGGFIDLPFSTELSSPTGNYTATLSIVVDDKFDRTIGSQKFKVEEFLPDRLRIRAQISARKNIGWLKPGDLICEVDLENLFGTAAQSRRVSGQMDLIPSSIHLQDFAAYVFDDPLRENRPSIDRIQHTLGDTSTDENGHAQLALDLARYDNGIYRLTVHVEGFEQGGGRSVKALTSVMMSPLDFLIGHKTDGKLDFINKGSDLVVHYIAVDSDANSVDVNQLRLTVVEYRYVSTLVKRPNGTYAYQSVRKEVPVSTQRFSVVRNGSSFALPTADAGAFAVLVSDEDALVYSKIDFTVAGARNVAQNLERDSELQLIMNGNSFSVGDDIDMQITAPYTGVGLITIERDRVYSHKWFRADSNTSVQTIRVPDGIEGNAYVNVAFIRELDSPEIYVSPLSYAIAPFSINRDARQVAIDLDVPALIRPGDDLNIGFNTSRNSRIVIFGVDEGILQLARYETPDPLSFFLRKMALQVSTFQMVDLILPDFAAYQRTAAPGGGYLSRVAGNNLNPFRRKTDAPVAFWSGIIDADSSTGTFRWTVPDTFNGQLRIMAVAVSESAVGHQSENTVVRGPFVISPNVLTAAAPGDAFDINVGLANNLEGSGENSRIELTVLASEHLQIIGDNRKTLHIAEGDEGRGQFRVRARNKLGSASLTFVASAEGVSSQLSASLSVRPPVPYVATVTTGNSNSDPITLRFDRELYDEFAQQTVAASASPLVLADGLLTYLDAYPHACAEQIVSKVFPQIGFLGNHDFSVDETEVRSLFLATSEKLRRRQGASGGFRFWASSAEPADFASVYVMHFFTDAAKLGLPVPRDMLRSGLGFLKQLAATEVTTIPKARLRAYAIYVLTRNGHITTSYLTNLHEFLDRSFEQVWRDDLVAAYMAGSYALLKHSDLAEQLIRNYEFGGGDEMSNDFDTRLGRDAQFVYLVAQHFPDRLSDIDANTLRYLIDPVMKNRFNTLSSAYTILALGEYTRAIAKSTAESELTISSVSNDTVEKLAEATRFVRAKVRNAVRDIQVSSSDRSDLFHVLSQAGFDTTPPREALSQGLEIHKEYIDEHGNTVSTARIGDELSVRLRVRSTGRSRTNVAVVDLLPGGFEVLRESLSRRHGAWRAAHIDVREDRVVVYGNFSNRISEIQYRVKLTSAGDFVVPSAFAKSMYDRSLHAHSKPGRFKVLANP